jgi:ParB family chromosome partitioning protein
MELAHIPLDQLKLTKVNVRHGRKAPDVSDILPSIRKRGILQPLLVRPNGEGYEVVAGRRRFFAAQKALEETGEFAPLPCAIMNKGDDAAAIESSLLENEARLPMDPMDRYEAFARLAKEGRSVAEIADLFATTEAFVRRTMALANLLPAIKRAYREDRIEHGTARLLTMATKAQQAEWLDLFESEDRHAPLGNQLKRWLLGGDNIRTTVALFPVEDYNGQLVTDLFAEEQYFADSEAFWQAQQQALETRAEEYRAKGWASVEVLERGAYFANWEHEKCSKKDGGRVFVTVSHNGEVTFHEGYITQREARAKERAASGAGEGDTDAKLPKPEITKAMERYLELHRHALVRADLLAHPDIALCMTVAHMIAGSALWTIRPDDQRAPKPEIEASVMASPSQAAFDAERVEILKLLGMDEDRSELVRHTGDTYWTATLFAKLLKLSRENVLRILTFAMTETLQSGSCLVEMLGVLMGTKAETRWQADDTFLDLLKDKATINAVLSDTAGATAAEANAKETGKVQKDIIRDCLTGGNGRKPVENWVPKWLRFPVQAHTNAPISTTRVGSEWERVASLL